MEARYRADYPGEFVILETQWENGKRIEKREWVANPIENHHISGRAACIGGTHSRSTFNFTRLQNHRGGLLGSKKLQTYGISEVAQLMRLDFTVATGENDLRPLIESNYDETNIVYSTPRNCLANPGRLYLIPYGTRLYDLNLLAYMAAFDGHQEIFLLGYDQDNTFDNHRWPDQLVEVFKAYPQVKFFLVGEPTNFHPQLLEQPNAEPQSYKQWVSYADI